MDGADGAERTDGPDGAVGAKRTDGAFGAEALADASPRTASWRAEPAVADASAARAGHEAARVIDRVAAWERRALVATCAAAAAALAVGLDVPALALAAVALVVLAPLTRGRRAAPPVEQLVVGAGTALALLTYRALGGAAPALAVFLLAAQGPKALAPSADRDSGLAAAIAIVLAGVAAAEGIEPSFAALLLACTLAAMAYAGLRSLRLQLGASSPGAPLARSDGPAPALAGGRARRALGAHVLAFMAVGAGTLVFFAGFPRIGAKLFSSPREARQRLAGFTDVVGLDDIGRIRRNTQVAFRAEPDGPLPEPLYWRGRALDSYDGATWSASRAVAGLRRPLDPDGQGGFRDALFPADAPGAPRRIVIHQEPLGARCLFLPGATGQVSFRATSPHTIYRDPTGALLTPRSYASPLAYELLSHPGTDDATPLDPVTARRVRRHCLAIPERVDRARLAEYGRAALSRRGVAADAPNHTVAAALARHLARSYRYSLDGPRTTDAEPIAAFLFSDLAGHCELFASAMVLILRSLEVPARLVTGYLGGERSPWSDAYVVRQSNAHAWVEVLGASGWRSFDPTPTEPGSGGAGSFVEALGDLVSWLELRWYARVIGFDAFDQANALRRLQRRAERLADAAAAGARRLSDAAAAPVLGMTLALGLLLTGAALAARRARRPRRSLPEGRATEARRRGDADLARLLAALAQRGLPRAAHETALEVARRADAALSAAPGSATPGRRDAAISRWVTHYYACRWGDRPLDAADRRELERLLGELERGAVERGVEPAAGPQP